MNEVDTGHSEGTAMNDDRRAPRALGEAADHYDVAILGGGITGLTLALQLRQAHPDVRVLVTEKQTHPVAEAAHKVGESSVEVQAHYLRDVLGLQDHLETEQLRKFGLRMFFSHEGNTDIARRVEYGQAFEAPLASYQLDRGRLENALGSRVLADGMDFLSNTTVQEARLQPEQDHHVVRVRQAGAEREVRARWIVDATGRAGMLKKQLGLTKKVGHHANAAWLRVGHPIDIDEWSDDPTWQGRIHGRRLSTNHLMGPGYWVWLIPLASGSTSIGIVADAETHSFDGFNRLDRAMEWLRAHEPQCAAAIDQHRDEIQDFRVMKDYAYGCEQVYSGDRWCLTGEAGVSIDPLYSSGGDLMAISNGLITDIIGADLRGDDAEDVEDRALGHNQLYLVMADVWLLAYQDQYRLMGNPQVMVAKVVWDTVIYWAFPGLLYFHDMLRRMADSVTTSMNLYRCLNLHTRVQAFFREWHEIDNPPASDVYADPYLLLDFLIDLHSGMAAGLDDDALEAQFTTNVRLLEQLAGQLVVTVVARLAARAGEEAVDKQVEEWLGDPLLAELIGTFRDEDVSNPIIDSWITLGFPSASPSSMTPESVR